MIKKICFLFKKFIIIIIKTISFLFKCILFEMSIFEFFFLEKTFSWCIISLWVFVLWFKDRFGLWYFLLIWKNKSNFFCISRTVGLKNILNRFRRKIFKRTRDLWLAISELILSFKLTETNFKVISLSYESCLSVGSSLKHIYDIKIS